MNRLERHRLGIQPASLIFVCTLLVVVAATGIFALTTSFSRVSGPGPISTFPRSWDNPCGFQVQGNETTIDNLANNPDFPVQLSLSQVYSKIVNSSAFQTLAAGRSWVTIQWDVFQSGNKTGFYEVVAGHFIFVSEGRPDGYVQMDYFIEGGEVTVGYSGPLGSFGCPPRSSVGYSASLMGSHPGDYTIGQPVKINFTVDNGSMANLNITSRTSCLGNFTVYFGSGRNATTVYGSTKHQGCSGPPFAIKLPPEEQYTQILEWNQTDDAGAQVPPGNYWMAASVAGQFVRVGEVSIYSP